MWRFFILLFPLFISCGKLQGEFGFKNSLDEGYRTKMERLEFSVDDEINWVYKFKSSPSGKVNLGIVILKRELSWVDVLAYPDYIDETKDVIYGTIKDFEPGNYKIVITQRKEEEVKAIDEIEFYLYSDDEEEESN